MYLILFEKFINYLILKFKINIGISNKYLNVLYLLEMQRFTVKLEFQPRCQLLNMYIFVIAYYFKFNYIKIFILVYNSQRRI
jgi:hypothetical protein